MPHSRKQQLACIHSALRKAEQKKFGVNDSILEKAGFDVHQIILGSGFVKIKDIASLSRTSCTLFRSSHHYLSRKGGMASKLLLAVLMGDEGGVKSILEDEPYLLFARAEATYRVRTGSYERESAPTYVICNSPYEAALKASDIPMLLLMQEYIDKIVEGELSGRQIALTQYNTQFPNGPHFESSDYDFSKIMNELIQVQWLIGNINKYSNFTNFKNEFKLNVSAIGWYFNVRHLTKLLELYEELYDLCGDSSRLNTFYAIAHLQQQLPTNWAQAMLQGLYHVVNGKQLQRKLEVPLLYDGMGGATGNNDDSPMMCCDGLHAIVSVKRALGVHSRSHMGEMIALLNQLCDLRVAQLRQHKEFLLAQPEERVERRSRCVVS